MKKKLLLILCILGMALAPSVLAEEITVKPTTYEVQITVVYNAVTELEVGAIAGMALMQHGHKSCEIKVNIKKNRMSDLVFSGTTLHIPNSNDSITYR